MANAGNEKRIEIKDDADLGLAMLIAEFGEGSYQAVAAVGSINETDLPAMGDMPVDGSGCFTGCSLRA